MHRESNAITATDDKGTTHIPAAAVGAILLGPGTKISHQATVLIADSGSTVVWVGERGVRCYAHGRSLARSTRLLEAQAKAVTNRRTRLEVARNMYAMRFPDEDAPSLTMQQLRGREGARVRRCYREHASRTGVEWKRREYEKDDWQAGSLVNQALSAANACLYGAVHAVVVALGCSPGLGFIHTGHELSFVHDVADLYKADVSIPVAFDMAAAEPEDIGRASRQGVRDLLYQTKLLDRCAADVRGLLLPDDVCDSQHEDEVDTGVYLWDEHTGRVAGGRDYGESVE